jgi:hypothetical protein
MYKNCLWMKAQYYRNRNSKNSQCCKTIFHIHLLVSCYCFIPPISNLPETAGCLKSQYHSEHFTVLRHCHYGVQLPKRKHHTPYGKTSSILHLQWKTKLKQIWGTATATSQNSVLMTFSGQDVVYYKNLWICNLLHTLLFPTLQTGIFPSALVCNSILPCGRETNLPTCRK